MGGFKASAKWSLQLLRGSFAVLHPSYGLQLLPFSTSFRQKPIVVRPRIKWCGAKLSKEETTHALSWTDTHDIRGWRGAAGDAHRWCRCRATDAKPIGPRSSQRCPPRRSIITFRPGEHENRRDANAAGECAAPAYVSRLLTMSRDGGNPGRPIHDGIDGWRQRREAGPRGHHREALRGRQVRGDVRRMGRVRGRRRLHAQHETGRLRVGPGTASRHQHILERFANVSGVAFSKDRENLSTLD